MGIVNDALSWLRPSRVLPQPVPDAASPVQARGSRYGDVSVQSIVSTKHVLADEGSYFITTNPTPSTKIDYGSGGTNATFSDTIAFWLIKNNDAVGGKRIFLDYIKLIHAGGTAPAATTSVHLAIKIDSKDRTATAGTPTNNTPSNVNIDSAVGSVGTLVTYSGAVPTTPAASASARLVARTMLKGGPTLVLDTYQVAFGVNDAANDGGYLTTVASYTSRAAPVVIGPTQNAVVYLWLLGATTNPFSYEFECGWWER